MNIIIIIIIIWRFHIKGDILTLIQSLSKKYLFCNQNRNKLFIKLLFWWGLSLLDKQFVFIIVFVVFNNGKNTIY